ncbi:hypothetical protein PanWU01x14_097180 [Parasponia andersonii]|uniref:Uncharacterized protein n=1 Tax=Parasponia andersonii TaxID=3476 RepID=A0A2P5D4J2_PARAD|nr:hypothetical protein PanWU01x14_097180 [Parasponia andersonii]
MALRSSEAMSLPFSRLMSSLKVGILASVKAWWSSLVRPWRVSSPLKLKNTSCLWWVMADQNENDDVLQMPYEEVGEEEEAITRIFERNTLLGFMDLEVKSKDTLLFQV